MNIHFVCRGNTYRSRLAEAYFNSLALPNWSAISSGIEATRDLNGPITPYAAKVIADHGLTLYGKSGWTQSTKEDLEASDIVVFLNEDVYRDCCHVINPELKKFYVWGIEDVEVIPDDRSEMDPITEAIFARIVEEINGLVKTLGVVIPDAIRDPGGP